MSLLGVAFLGLSSVVLPMLQNDGSKDVANPRAEMRLFSFASPLVLLGLVLMLGFYVPPFLNDLLRDAAQLLGGR